MNNSQSRAARFRNRRLNKTRGFAPETLETRILLAGDTWHNINQPLDTTGDGEISPKDALAVFAEINNGKAGEITDESSFIAMVDVNGDNYLTPRDGLEVVRHLNDGAQGEDGALIQLRLEVTSRDSLDAVDVLSPNQDFFLRVFATDLTPEAEGVFTAYLDVEYDANLADADGTIDFSDDFGDGQAGDVSVDGLLDEIGGLDQTQPDDGSAEILVLSVPLRTESETGTLNFTGNPADILPLHEILLFRDTNTILDDEIMFVNTSVVIQDDSVATAIDDAFNGTEDTLLSRTAAQGVLANDVGAGITAVLETGPSNGTLDLNSDGSFTYQPDANFFGTDSFTYRANNGQSSNLATVQLTIQSVNDAPVAVNDSFETPGGTPLVRTAPADGILANDIDVENSELSVILTQITGPSNGTLDLNANGGFVYTPNGGFSGVDSFTYLASDGESLSQLATVTITVGSDASPVAANDSFVTLSDTTLNVTAANSVLVNDTDPNGLPLTAVLFSTTTNGTLDLDDDGTFTYVPDADFFGVDSFRYFVSNGTEVSATATVTINVSDSNVAPVAVNDAYFVDEDQLLQVSVENGILSNDTDVDGDTLTATLVDGPANGTIEFFQDDGQFEYRPDANFTGLDEFTYVVSDGRATDTGVVRITVGPQEEAPDVVDDEYSVVFGTTLAVSAADGVLANDSDVDGTPLTAQIVISPTNGTLDLDLDGSFEYTPNDGFEGTDTFIYVVGNGSVSQVGLVTLNVQEEVTGPIVNIRLVATDLNGNEITTALVGEQFQIRLFAEDTSPEPREGVFASYADIEWNGDLAIVSGPLEFSEDYPNGRRGNTLTPGLVDEAGAFQGENEDASEDELVLIVPLQASASGELVFSTNPADDLPFGNILLFDTVDTGLTEFVPEDLIFYGETSITIEGNPVPIAAPDNYTTQGPLTVSAANGVLANDIGNDGVVLTASVTSQPAGGTVQLNADGSFTYVPAAGFVGTDSFTYMANAAGESSTATTVTIFVENPDPSSISGFVYFDTDNNGLRDDEHAFGGVLVTLTGTTAFGDAVSLSTRTSSDGMYFFGDLVEGNYLVQQDQPAIVIDGIDSAAGGDVAVSDNAFQVNLGASENLSELNFGERGLMPAYFGNAMFMSNRLSSGVGIGVAADGSTSWYCSDGGFAGLRAFQASVSADGQAVSVTAINNAGQLVGGTFSAASRNVQILGNAADGYFVRLLGDSSGFPMTPITAPSAAAVDAALAS